MTAADGARPRVHRGALRLAAAVLVPLFRHVHRTTIRGAGHIPASGAVLIVCNHISVWDPPMIGAAVHPRALYYMAKRELFRNRVVGRVIGRLGAFPVDRGGADRGAIRTAREILARGDALLMFPEGTRSPDGRLGAPWPGAGSLALEPGVAVVPVAIWGSQRRFGPVRIEFGRPLDLSDLPAGARAVRARAASERMMEAIAALLARAGGPVREGTA
jgi:1-acyl-sn-glycerol-3-phosphate acyltransferase